MTFSICGNCGTGLPYGVGRCPSCGLPVVPAQLPQQPPQPPQQPPQQPYGGPGLQPPQQPPPQPYTGGPYGTGPYAGGPYATGPYAGPPGPPPVAAALRDFGSGDWLGALRTAVLAVLTMLAVSLAGMVLIAGGELGFRETVLLVLGGVCLAVGGDVFVEAQASVTDFASAGFSASVGILPLTVTLAGTVVLGASFARRLRRGGVTRGRDVLFQLVRTALLFALLFLPLALLTRYTPDSTGLGELGGLVDIGARVGVGVWSTLSGALMFAGAAMGLVALLRRSGPLLGRLRPRVQPALMGALTVFAAGVVAAVVFVTWGLLDIGGDEGSVQFLGSSVLGFVNGMLGAVLWTAGVPLGTGNALAFDQQTVPDVAGLGGDSVTLLTFTGESGLFWLAPVVLAAVMLTVAVVVVLRQHTMRDARLEGLRFAVALALVAVGAALLLRIAASTSASGGGSGFGAGFGTQVGVTAAFNPFIAGFVLLLWGGVAGLLAPVIAARLPSGLVRAVRGRFGMAPPPAAGPPPPMPPMPPPPSPPPQ